MQKVVSAAAAKARVLLCARHEVVDRRTVRENKTVLIVADNWNAELLRQAAHHAREKQSAFIPVALSVVNDRALQALEVADPEKIQRKANRRDAKLARFQHNEPVDIFAKTGENFFQKTLLRKERLKICVRPVVLRVDLHVSQEGVERLFEFFYVFWIESFFGHGASFP